MDRAADRAPFVALFEKTVAAVSEGRRASAALLRDPVAVDAGAIDSLRAHEMVVALDDFGRKTGGDMGAYARTVAMLVAANNFLLVGRVPAAQRPFAAEPLLTMMLGSEFLSYGSDEPTVTWAEYIGAAGRSIEAAPGAQVSPIPKASATAWSKCSNFAGSELRAVSGKLAPTRSSVIDAPNTRCKPSRPTPSRAPSRRPASRPSRGRRAG